MSVNPVRGKAGPDRLKTGTSDGGLPSQTSKLSALARGTSGKDKIPKTSTQPSVSTSAAKHNSSSVRVPSKTPPAIRRHSETTPRIYPWALTYPERRKESSSRISKEPFNSASSGGRKLLKVATLPLTSVHYSGISQASGNLIHTMTNWIHYKNDYRNLKKSQRPALLAARMHQWRNLKFV
jgi:hypothetical protein